jgi:hypothetical protein
MLFGAFRFRPQIISDIMVVASGRYDISLYIMVYLELYCRSWLLQFSQGLLYTIHSYIIHTDTKSRARGVAAEDSSIVMK